MKLLRVQHMLRCLHLGRDDENWMQSSTRQHVQDTNLRGGNLVYLAGLHCQIWPEFKRAEASGRAVQA